jgi:adenosylcobinamide kinase/adenosylcobinamide-phosphate guanylyltransferase
MHVRMLGTGSSDGWPNPWCGCASCRAATAAGVLRGQTSALVDGRLLLDLVAVPPERDDDLTEAVRRAAKASDA